MNAGPEQPANQRFRRTTEPLCKALHEHEMGPKGVSQNSHQIDQHVRAWETILPPVHCEKMNFLARVTYLGISA